MNYNPTPINTSDINLPEELIALTEKIAPNVHSDILEEKDAKVICTDENGNIIIPDYIKNRCICI